MKKKTVFVGMSGGVDSSVAAYLLKKEGYNVIGVFMRCYNLDGCSERDAEDARRVAEQLNIPFYALDFEAEYKQRVVDYMVQGYRDGFTPNPDVMCNREIKFGIFLDKALAMGADYIATGHYVRLKRKGVLAKLYAGLDVNKDQSYFLWTLTQKQLSRCLFPIGDYEKSDIRKIAKKAGLSTAAKKDSQGICFLGQVTLDDFLKDYIPAKKGKILTATGVQIGDHKGAHFYTIGQRHVGGDLRIRGRKGDLAPHYVVSKDVKTNTITVAEGRDHELLFKSKFALENINFISSVGSDKKTLNMPVLARVRYRQPLAEAVLKRKGKSFEIVFKKPRQFVAEGQSAVWYSKSGEMLGGGVIYSSI
jgi:tRNA-specific 2-thiouridylase